MRGLTKAYVATGCLLLVGGVVQAQNAGWLKGSPDEKFKLLAEIQPGLGTIMIEYSQRFTNIWYAAQGGNWELADYQLKEALEIQEVGETTRPKRAEPLKTYEGKFLDPLGNAITAKNKGAFETAFKAAQDGCNACHKDQGFDYIKYELPKAPISPLKMTP